MAHPLLYEINTRCWLRELSATCGARITLRTVPDSQFAEWRRLGFTHIWLMGVWSSGPRARQQALAHAELQQSFSEALPDWQERDIGGSPYAISDYRVPASLGGDKGLEEFREKLHAHGLKLVLDFVPNHLGLDHSWASEQPHLFVQSPVEVPETLPEKSSTGIRWLAHGKDPYFPAWSDTLQLDYRKAVTRAAMIELLQSIAQRCDGVRCDMAMLLLNDVFTKTWERFPLASSPRPSVGEAGSEFWAEAISTIKQGFPDFLFLAEAYWGLERRLQALGFDYTYDKVLYDGLVSRDAAGVQRHLLGMSAQSVAAGVHFLENHDEPRIASLLSPDEHRAAALLILGLPGMRFLHQGQLCGARLKTPVQLLRRSLEPNQPLIERCYDLLLTTLPSTAVGKGQGQILEPRAAWPGNPTARNFAIVQWQAQPSEFDLVVVNLAPHPSQCCVPLTSDGLSACDWSMKDLLGQEQYARSGADLQNPGLYLALPAHGAQLFHFQPAARELVQV